MKIRNRAIRIVVSWLGLIIFFMLTNPFSLPVPFLIVPYALIWIAIYQLHWIVPYSSSSNHHAHDAKRRFAAIIVSSIVVICLGLESIGELAARDLITISIFGGLAFFYAARNGRKL